MEMDRQLMFLNLNFYLSDVLTSNKSFSVADNFVDNYKSCYNTQRVEHWRPLRALIVYLTSQLVFIQCSN